MEVSFYLISLLNGLSLGLLLFMLASGLTLIFSMMGVLNFAHASFYMVGAYVAYSIARVAGFWPGLFIAPVVVGMLGALFERYCLRRVHKFGHVPELLITFGLSYVMLELVQLIWGRAAVEALPPPSLQGPAFTLVNSSVDGLHWEQMRMACLQQRATVASVACGVYACLARRAAACEMRHGARREIAGARHGGRAPGGALTAAARRRGGR